MSGRTATMTVEERKEKKRAYMREYRKRVPMTVERREKWNAYQRQYKKNNPEKMRRQRETYIINKAAQILAEREAEGSVSK